MRDSKASLEDRQAWMRERHAPAAQPFETGRDLAYGDAPAFQRHFSPRQLAKLWELDESTIRRLFQDEPGVLKIGKQGRRDGKRDYVSLRIPESVAARVHKERSQ